MVGRIAFPNPDITPDKNIIHFKIDYNYVKNGTLDGYIGFDPDPDLSGARSYFRPKE